MTSLSTLYKMHSRSFSIALVVLLTGYAQFQLRWDWALLILAGLTIAQLLLANQRANRIEHVREDIAQIIH
ncbi:MAG: hypothetical protein VXZ35_13060, partial [Pseudomonadota bacterium]|nr:hypothetical protein [Pseudomonadota bacterium]